MSGREQRRRTNGPPVRLILFGVREAGLRISQLALLYRIIGVEEEEEEWFVLVGSSGRGETGRGSESIHLHPSPTVTHVSPSALATGSLGGSGAEGRKGGQPPNRFVAVGMDALLWNPVPQLDSNGMFQPWDWAAPESRRESVSWRVSVVHRPHSVGGGRLLLSMPTTTTPVVSPLISVYCE